MIVRDEARHLPACFASLKGIADELVVVDTGSVDDSAAIARDHGAKVLHHPWNDDFSAPRNVGLEHATGRWILYIDADERLRPTDRSRVHALLEKAPEIAFQVRLHPAGGYTPSLDYRLWRNDPRIRFRGVIHEKVIYSLEEAACEDGKSIGVCALALDHVGYEGDQTRKHQRNLPLLRAQLAGEPDNIFNWRHLAQVLIGLGLPEEAERALERAVALARDVRNEHGSVAWSDLVRLRRDRGEDVTELVAEGRARWPENWWLVWAEGQLHFEAGRHDEAIGCFQRLVEVDLRTLPFHGVAYDERIFGSFAHAAVGLALFRMGRYAEAAEAYAAAEHLEPEAPEYRVKRQLAESKAPKASPQAAPLVS